MTIQFSFSTAELFQPGAGAQGKTCARAGDDPAIGKIKMPAVRIQACSTYPCLQYASIMADWF